jgi:CPA2 family monovalent cation:H+ antiporter-2
MTGPLERWLGKNRMLAAKFDRAADPLAELPMTTAPTKLAGQVVLVGYGRVGKRIAETLNAQGIHYVVAEQNREKVDQLRQAGVAAVAGNAAEAVVLIQAHVAKARMLVIATPDTFHVRAMVDVARTLNPAIRIVVRTHNDEEAALLRKERMGKVFVGEEELADGMTDYVLETFKEPHNGGGH